MRGCKYSETLDSHRRAWHDLRLEIIGTRIRAFVNGGLKFEFTDATLAGRQGRNALLMWKTAADVESYVAYEP
jgi:hypothetical protein